MSACPPAAPDPRTAGPDPRRVDPRADPGPRSFVDGTPGSATWWSQRERRLQRRRPRADGLTVERIVEAAVHLVDAEGLQALTVRRLAAGLGTGSASLYRHVASREELLVLLVDHVLGSVRLPAGHLPGRAKVEWLSGELRRVLIAHPRLVPALGVAPLLGPNAMRGTENGLANLLDAGFEGTDAVWAYFALVDYVLGTVFFDTSSARRDNAGVAERTSSLPAGDFPRLRALGATFAGRDDEVVFLFGLRAFLDGLALRLQATEPAVGGPGRCRTRER